jgi:hypothetical protein
MPLLHETERVDSLRDTYFICGTNPDGNGGGVIATRMTLENAHKIQRQAIMQGYTRVRVWTWYEMNDDSLHGD